MTEKIIKGITEIFDIYGNQYEDEIDIIYENRVLQGFKLDNKNLSGDFNNVIKKIECEKVAD